MLVKGACMHACRYMCARASAIAHVHGCCFVLVCLYACVCVCARVRHAYVFVSEKCMRERVRACVCVLARAHNSENEIERVFVSVFLCVLKLLDATCS